MTAGLIACYTLTGAGLGLLAWTLLRLSAMAVDEMTANPQLIELAKAGDVERARTLCSAAPGTYLDAVRDACAIVSASTPSREPLDAAAQSAFDTTASAFVRRWSKAIGRGWLGGFLVLAGYALALSRGGFTIGLVIVGILGTLGAVRLFMLRDAATRAIASARADVLPVLLDAAHSAAQASRPSEPRALIFRVSRDGKEIESRPFCQDTIKIGRITSSHLILDHSSVSRLHARVENTGDSIEIIDLGSSSGTFVNGQRVNKTKLSDGDTIEIGTFQLKLAIGA